jgi:replication-associated recombination protein RarA
MEPYGPREMKKIINRFISACPEYATVTNQAKVLDEIVTEANGDARKALHIIYTQKIREMGRAYPFKNAIQCRIKFYEEESK